MFCYYILIISFFLASLGQHKNLSLPVINIITGKLFKANLIPDLFGWDLKHLTGNPFGVTMQGTRAIYDRSSYLQQTAPWLPDSDLGTG